MSERGRSTGPRVLLTGATGVLGTAIQEALRASAVDVDIVTLARRPGTADIAWNMGMEQPPPDVRGPWDVVVHTAASTRWTMTPGEATRSNIQPVQALLEILSSDTHVVHVSTAYVGGDRTGVDRCEWPGQFRNAYEWSKAECESLLRGALDRLTIIRPPLILGARTTGHIAHFSGPYTVLQSLCSGMAAALVGDPGGYAEIAPVDEVAQVVVDTVIEGPPRRQRVAVVAAGAEALTLQQFAETACGALNSWRAARSIAPIAIPPTISPDSWHRFYLPLSDLYLSPIQRQAVTLLNMFESYTSMRRPFTPTSAVRNPAQVLENSVHYWAENRPRLAARRPAPWVAVRS